MARRKKNRIIYKCKRCKREICLADKVVGNGLCTRCRVHLGLVG